jgi:hypothetical protein
MNPGLCMQFFPQQLVSFTYTFKLQPDKEVYP